MKKRLAGLAVSMLGIALIFFAAMWSTSGAGLFVAVGAVLVIAGSGVLLASQSGTKSSALMRLDWFLPFFQKRSQGRTRHSSWLRAALKRIGPSVVSSPARRAVQAVCFVIFLVLFYYVCWPYTAQPRPPGQESAGWELVDIDQQTGAVRLSYPRPPAWALDGGRTVHVVNQGAASDDDGYVGAFEVVPSATDQVQIQPLGEPNAEQFDRLVTGLGPWRVSEDPPSRWPSHYADDLISKEVVSADLFLMIDPLVSVSTAIAARSWVWSLTAAGVILVLCLFIPRGFCGYICPLGTIIDLFDWSVTRHFQRFQVADNGWWVHIKYYLLIGTLVCSLCGVLISGFFAAIPVITRALLFITEPLQVGVLRGWHQVPSMNAGHFISIALFLGVLALGFLRPRFWCRYVCPTGAVFSLSNVFRVTERKVESTCINCNKCVEICPFDAIKPDFTTRGSDCTLCQTCGGVCPTHAIKFVERWNRTELKVENDPPTGDTRIGRRGFVSWVVGSIAAAAGGMAVSGAIRASIDRSNDGSRWHPVRPPGSVPEPAFLQMCIRCGECFKVCPNNVLQAEGFEQGLDGLWTPQVVADWAGCESSCNACGQVCPTGAIRALPLDEKRVARMGLAIVNEQTCLPFADKEACQLCVDECNAAGYEAIEFTHVHTDIDSDGLPIEGSGFLAPVVSAEKCVGCGLCQTRCNGINVKTKSLLKSSAVIIAAGPGKEDRLTSGSYIELRAAEARARMEEQSKRDGASEFFVPDAEPKKEPPSLDDSENPFG